MVDSFSTLLMVLMYFYLSICNFGQAESKYNSKSTYIRKQSN